MVSGYKGWKVAWMPLFGPCLLHGDSLDSFVHPRALPGYPQHSACSFLYFTKIHNLQVCLLYHMLFLERKGLCLQTHLPPKCSTQARFARYLNTNHTLCLVLLKKDLVVKQKRHDLHTWSWWWTGKPATPWGRKELDATELTEPPANWQIFLFYKINYAP